MARVSSQAGNRRDVHGNPRRVRHALLHRPYSYLIDLAAPTGDILDKSLVAFREELERAEALGLDYLVTHMGAHMGEGEEIGLERLSKSLDKIHGPNGI